MTKRKQRDLPPEPVALTDEQLKRGTNRFGKIDEIIRKMLAAGDLHPNVDKYRDAFEARHLAWFVPAPGLFGSNETVLLYLVRRLVLNAGLAAHRRAQKDRAGGRAARKLLAKKVEAFRSLGSEIREMAKRGWADCAADFDMPVFAPPEKMTDPNLSFPTTARFNAFESLLIAMKIMEPAEDKLDEFADWWADAETGKQDVLTREFIVNIAMVWRTLKGVFPPASREGPFVEFANAAWSALGWDEYPDRASDLGKRAEQIGAQMGWTFFRRLEEVPPVRRPK